MDCSVGWEKYILQALPRYFKALETLNVPPPYLTAISLLNVRGYQMYVGYDHWTEGHPVDRDHLLTDEMLIEDPSQPPHKLLRPLFDQVSNRSGFARSLNYNEKGDWVQRKEMKTEGNKENEGRRDQRDGRGRWDRWEQWDG